MGLHQYVQRRNTIGYAVGIAVLLCQIAGHGHIKLRRQQKGSALLHGEVYIHHRLRRVLLRHGDGIGFYAAGNRDLRAICHGDRFSPAVFSTAHRNRDLVIFVFGSGRDVHGVHTGGHRQRVGRSILVKGRRQAAGAGRQGAEVTLVGPELSAQIRTIADTGVHDPDHVPGAQCAVGNCEAVETRIHEPIVQRTHPAGFRAAVKGGKAVDGADVAAVQALSIITIQCLTDAAHHGGTLCQRNIGIHQCAVPGRAVRFGICGVFHNDLNCSQVLVCPACQDRCGEHSQQQSRCQKQAQQSPFH